MAWPEPSLSDCGAPWNQDEDEAGDIICSCTGCKRARKNADIDWDDIYEREDER